MAGSLVRSESDADLHTERGPREAQHGDGHPQAKDRDLRRSHPGRHLDLELVTSQSVRQ